MPIDKYVNHLTLKKKRISVLVHLKLAVRLFEQNLYKTSRMVLLSSSDSKEASVADPLF